mgnify:CR=1 FL=1
MYKLGITQKKGAPPILLSEKGDIMTEGDYVLGSIIFAKIDTLEEVDPTWSGNKLKPDKHWKIYPAELYKSAPYVLPFGNVYTNFVAPKNPGHFLRYEIGSTQGSREYARLLTEFIESQRPKTESLYSKDKKKIIESELRETNDNIKVLKKKLQKIKLEISKSSRKHGKGRGLANLDKLKIEETDIGLQIVKLEQKIKRLEVSLKPYGYNKNILPKK